jgi:hypothetical protein
VSGLPTDEASSNRLYAAVDLVAARYDADTLLYSGPIGSPGFAQLVAAVLRHTQRKTCLLILTTSGGELHTAYQITRFLHHKYSRLYLCAPAFCKGAGMLLAVGAHKLLIDEYSELGRVGDPASSATHRAGLLCREWLPNNAMSLLDQMTTRLLHIHGSALRADSAALIAGIVTAALMQPIMSQIGPTRMAEEYRLTGLAAAYARRLARHARNMRDGAVDRLLTDYPPQFVVDLAEARALFVDVDAPSGPLSSVLNLLGEQVYVQRQTAIVTMLRRPKPAAAEVEHPHALRRHPASAVVERRMEQRSGRARAKPAGRRRRAGKERASLAGKVR